MQHVQELSQDAEMVDYLSLFEDIQAGLSNQLTQFLWSKKSDHVFNSPPPSQAAAGGK